MPVPDFLDLGRIRPASITASRAVSVTAMLEMDDWGCGLTSPRFGLNNEAIRAATAKTGDGVLCSIGSMVCKARETPLASSSSSSNAANGDGCGTLASFVLVVKSSIYY